MTPRHEAARARALEGIPIFPLEENGKKPVTKNGFYDATTDLDQIDLWWSREDRNLALCPANANLFVVDIDPGADLSILEKLPATYTVRTPRDGYHLYFSGVGPSSTNKIAHHIDTRSIGGYVVLPPSIINGKSYYVEKAIEYAPLPEWVTERVKKIEPIQRTVDIEEDLPANVQRARTLLKEYVKIGRVSVIGNAGDSLCYKICCEMLDLGLSIDKAAELMDTIWNPHCEPRQWEYDKLLVKLKNAAEYKQNKGAVAAVEPSQEVFSEPLAKINMTQKEEETKKPFIYIRDRETQLNSPSAEMQIETILPYKKLVLPYGDTGAGKTYWSTEIVTAIAMDRPAFGKFKVLKPGPVVIFAGEDCDRLEQSRLTAIETHYGQSLQGLVYTVETAIPIDDNNLSA